jgi:hypothetical protein
MKWVTQKEIESWKGFADSLKSEEDRDILKDVKWIVRNMF